MKIFLILLGFAVYCFILLYGMIWEKMNEDELIDKMYERIERRGKGE